MNKFEEAFYVPYFGWMSW